MCIASSRGAVGWRSSKGLTVKAGVHLIVELSVQSTVYSGRSSRDGSGGGFVGKTQKRVVGGLLFLIGYEAGFIRLTGLFYEELCLRLVTSW